jgi:hypothetical protein
MAHSFDIINCNHAEFLNHLEESNPKEQNFKNIWEKINVKYVEVSNDIYKLNEKRHELLEKIKASQIEYKRLFGLGEIKPVIDANEDEEVDNSNVQEPKISDKKGRKKTTPTDNLIDENDEDVVNVPKMKSKEPKKISKIAKDDKEPEPELDTDDGEIPLEHEHETVIKKVVKTQKTIIPPAIVSKKVITKKVDNTEETPSDIGASNKNVKKLNNVLKEPEEVALPASPLPVSPPPVPVKTSGKKKTTK